MTNVSVFKKNIKSDRKTSNTVGLAYKEGFSGYSPEPVESWYRSLVECTDDSVYLVDRQCRYLFVNTKHLVRMGVSAGQVVGRNYEDFHSSDRTSTFNKMVESVFTTDKSVQHEHYSERDGRYFLRTLSPVKGPAGPVEMVAVISKDITNLKNLEASLRETRDRYQRIFQNLQDIYYEITEDGVILEFSPSVTRSLGYAREELIGASISDLYVELGQRNALLENLNLTGEVKDYEIELRNKQGAPVPCAINAVIITDERDGVRKIIGSLRDISERKRAEEKLRKSENKYRTIFENTGNAAIIIDPDLTISLVNTEFEKLSGWTKKEVQGRRRWTDFIAKEDRNRTIAFFNGRKDERSKQSTHDECLFVTAEGSVKTVLLTVAPFPECSRWIATFIDITEHRKAERESEERRQFLEGILASAPDAIVTQDAKRTIIEWNAGAERLFGYTREEALGKNLDSLVNCLNQEETLSITDIILNDLDAPPTEVIRCRKDRQPVHALATGSPIKVEGEIIGSVIVYTDIAKLKQFEETLHQEKEKFRVMVEEGPLGVMIVDLKGSIKYVNPVISRITGYGINEIPTLEHFYDAILRSDGRKKKFDALWTAEGSAKEQRRPHSAIIAITSKDSVEKIALFRRVALERGDYFIIVEDITDQRKLELQLQQAQKMEAIGTLAGGIAHDFNNLLMGIQGNASLGNMHLTPDHPSHERLKNIEQYVQSGAELTKQLLGFARRGKYEAKPTKLNTFIQKNADMFGRTKKEIRIFTNFDPDVWTVDVDRSQMEQVLLNLFVNAWQAMPGGGKLFLSTSNTVLDESYVKPYTVTPGRYVKVSITDTGVGMDEATMKRIFDPFFTTKEMGRGTGLGLACVYGIVKNHGGFINVYSEERIGSTFTIYIPVSETDAVLPEESAPSEAVRMGKGTILLVDDEEMIVSVGRDLLNHLGYDVLTATSGHETLEIYNAKGSTIDLVIIDMIMPELDGGATFDRLKEMNENVSVLLSSGYSLNGKASEIIQRGCRGFIQKPFTIGELSRKVVETINNKPNNFLR
ncbi:MAG: PAS domain S-box protein [Deltaproteobacteria bacterium]|nr:PAS domain S-box protein [Deltaproteobacteria bacterium]